MFSYNLNSGPLMMKLLERRNGNIFKGTTADAGTLKIDEIEAVITR